MTLILTRTTRLVAAVVLTVAAGLVAVVAGPAAPASASVCGTDRGVTVIVDFNQLGGGVQGTCLTAGGGQYAAKLFEAASFTLSYASRQPGFVCRVSGVPAADPCVNTSPSTKYWGLWVSDGNPGSGWDYSTLGVGSLKVPDGWLVAFSWDEVDGREQPSAASTRPAPTGGPTSSSPTSTPTTRPPASTPPTSTPPTSRPPTGGPTGPGVPGTSGSTSAPASPSSAPPTSDGASPSEEPVTPTDSASTDAAPTKPPESADPTVADPSPPAGVNDPAVPDDPAAASDTEGSLPGWVAPLVVALLFAGAGAAALIRRRQTRP